MTDHAYVALIDAQQQFDQVEDFLAALVREGAGYANDIGVLDVKNHFDRDSLLVLFTADRGLVDACFHLEFGFNGPVRFEHLDAFETDGDEEGVEIVGFHSLADEAGDAADSPEKVFAYVRGLKGWTRGKRRAARANPAAYDEAATEWNERLAEMLPVATIAGSKPAAKSTSKPARKKAAAGKASKKPAVKKAARGKAPVKAKPKAKAKVKSKVKAKAKAKPKARKAVRRTR
ncbi:MAG: hypothetical protein ACRC6L_10070 [Steroidobacteraceae bacterium]